MSQTNVSHVVRARSFVIGLIPFPEVGMGPEMNTFVTDSRSVSPGAGESLFSGSQSQFSFAGCQETQRG